MTAETAIYGVDIGVYYFGATGQPTSSTTFAWCRLTKWEDRPFLHSRSGISLTELAEQISEDLASRVSVAIGFEAPMWIPAVTATKHLHGPLFEPRFPAEEKHQWYLQSGAAASLKAVALGYSLFTSLRRLGVEGITTTTVPSEWATEAEILLFEGFVAGSRRWTVNQPKSPHLRDAWTVAFACWETLSRPSSPRPRSEILHDAGAGVPATISLWRWILEASGFARHRGPADCRVVALREARAGVH